MGSVLSFAEFASRIRSKYPGAYDDLSDEDLSNKVTEKYPVYRNAIDWGGEASRKLSFGSFEQDNASRMPPTQPKPSQESISDIQSASQAEIGAIRAKGAPLLYQPSQAVRNGPTERQTAISDWDNQRNKINRANEARGFESGYQSRIHQTPQTPTLPLENVQPGMTLPTAPESQTPREIAAVANPTRSEYAAERAGVPRLSKLQSALASASEGLRTAVSPVTNALTGRDAEQRQGRIMQLEANNYAMQDQAKKLEAKAASGQQLTKNEQTLLNDSKTGVIDGTVDFFKAIATDPEARNDMIEIMGSELPITILTAPIAEASLARMYRTAKGVANAYRARKAASLIGSMEKTGVSTPGTAGRFASMAASREARQGVADAIASPKDSRTLKNILDKTGMKVSPQTRMAIAGAAREIPSEAVNEGVIGTATGYGRGENELDAQALASNMLQEGAFAAGSGLAVGAAKGLHGATEAGAIPIEKADQAAQRVDLRPWVQDQTLPEGVTRPTRGNERAGVSSVPAAESAKAHPQFLELMGKVAQSTDNPELSGQRFRIQGDKLDVTTSPELAQSNGVSPGVNRVGGYSIPGYSPRENTAVVTGHGDAGTLSHEVIHAVDRMVHEDDDALAGRIDNWKQGITNWARKNGWDVPTEPKALKSWQDETLTKTLNTRLGGKEDPAFAKVPMPDAMIQAIRSKAGDVVSNGSVDLRGDRMGDMTGSSLDDVIVGDLDKTQFQMLPEPLATEYAFRDEEAKAMENRDKKLKAITEKSKTFLERYKKELDRLTDFSEYDSESYYKKGWNGKPIPQEERFGTLRKKIKDLTKSRDEALIAVAAQSARERSEVSSKAKEEVRAEITRNESEIKYRNLSHVFRVENQSHPKNFELLEEAKEYAKNHHGPITLEKSGDEKRYVLASYRGNDAIIGSHSSVIDESTKERLKEKLVNAFAGVEKKIFDHTLSLSVNATNDLNNEITKLESYLEELEKDGEKHFYRRRFLRDLLIALSEASGKDYRTGEDLGYKDGNPLIDVFSFDDDDYRVSKYPEFVDDFYSLIPKEDIDNLKKAEKEVLDVRIAKNYELDSVKGKIEENSRREADSNMNAISSRNRENKQEMYSYVFSNEDAILQAYTDLEKEDGARKYGPESRSKRAAQIAKMLDNTGNLSAFSDKENSIVGFRLKNGGHVAVVFDEYSKEAHIEAESASSKGKKDGGGSLLYLAALSWIRNNGLTLVDDPRGITQINAYVRRTANMISHMLRSNGESGHLSFHEKQGVDDSGEKGSTLFNALMTESGRVFDKFPEFKRWSIDKDSGKLLDEEGQEMSISDMNDLAEKSMHGGFGNDFGIGKSTLLRAIITNSLSLNSGKINRFPSQAFTEKYGPVLYQFKPAEEAGIPEGKANDTKVVERAEQLWRAKGVESPFFKRWFAGSKVVDENGKPLVVYHGTDANFNVFDLKKLGEKTFDNSNDIGTAATSKVGFWFNDGIKNAKNFPSKSDFLPVYLKLENPIKYNSIAELAEDLRSYVEQWNDDDWRSSNPGVGFNDLINGWRIDRLGNNVDGLVVDDEEFGGISYVAFSPAQIKSATNNRGTFGAENPDIRYQLNDGGDEKNSLVETGKVEDLPNVRASKSQESTETSVVPANKLTDAEVSSTMPEGWLANQETPETKTDVVVRKIADYLDPLKKLENKVPAKSESSAYRQADLGEGRAQARMERVREKYMDPVTRLLSKHGLGLDELDRFLYARHAPERNAQVASINPDFADVDRDGGSGMGNTQAKRILEWFRSNKTTAQNKALEACGKIVDRMMKESLTQRKSAGLLSDEAYNAYGGKYEHYIPLRGKPGEESSSRPQIGKGMVAKVKNKRALGRWSQAKDVTAQAFTQAFEGIKAEEQNEVGKRVLDMAQKNPDQQFWTIDKAPTKYVFDKNMGEAKLSPDVRMDAPNEYPVYIDGDRHVVRFHTDSGKRVCAALKGLTQEQGNAVLATLGKTNRIMAALVTNLSPKFVVTNALRDAQTAMAVAYSRDGAEVAKDMGKGMPGALRGIWAVEFGNASAGVESNVPALPGKSKPKGNGEWAEWYDRYKMAGGKTAFVQIKQHPEFSREVVADLKNAGRSKASPKRLFRGALESIEKTNAGVENAWRLSYFRTLIGRGTPEDVAAAKAKDLTVNFNRRGEWRWASQVFMFFNASVQGSRNVIDLFTNKETRGRVLQATAALAATGAATALFNRWLGGEDEESGKAWWDRVKPWERENRAVLLMPWMDDGSGAKIPLAYGFNVPFIIGQNLADLPYRKDPLDASANIVSAIMGAFSPVGTDPLTMITPTIARPVVEAFSTNRDFSGRTITPEQASFGAPKPQSQLYYPGASPWIVGITDALNEATGGSERVSGSVDISPEKIEHLVDGYTGGLGQIAKQVFSLAGDAVERKPVEPRQIPIASALWRKDANSDQQDMTPIVKKGLQKMNEFKALTQEDKGKAAKYMNDNYASIMLGQFASETPSIGSALRKAEQHGQGTAESRKDVMHGIWARTGRQWRAVQKMQDSLSSEQSESRKDTLRSAINRTISMMFSDLKTGSGD